MESPWKTFLAQAVGNWRFSMFSEILQSIDKPQAHRPEDMKIPEDPKTQSIKENPTTTSGIFTGQKSVWKVNMSDTVSATGFQSGYRKLKNQSVRKTTIGRMLDGNFHENYVISLGHQRQMSVTLSRRKETENASTSEINSGSNDNSARFPPVSSIQPENSAISVCCSSSSNALEESFLVQTFLPKQDTYFKSWKGRFKFVNEPAAKRPRRIVIESVDEINYFLVPMNQGVFWVTRFLTKLLKLWDLTEFSGKFQVSKWFWLQKILGVYFVRWLFSSFTTFHRIRVE